MLLLNDVLQVATATVLCLVCALLIRHLRYGQYTWVGVAFTLCIICYVIVESAFIQSSPLLRVLLSVGAISVPVLYWLMARAIFDDHLTIRWTILVWPLLLCAIFFAGRLASLSGIHPVTSTAGRFGSLVFVLLGVYTAVRTRHGDLVDSRIRFRNIFLLVTAALIGITLIVELMQVSGNGKVLLQIFQRTGILLLSVYFLLSTFTMRSGFFFREMPKPKAVPQEDPALNARLQALIDGEKIYRKEGLTIGQLAEIMNEQEYRLRRLINGHLGFRNFNDFLNQYRIGDACAILSDPEQQRKTILEIAYEMGYQSIGPFNKAFRELKGTTPTAYRKTQVKEG